MRLLSGEKNGESRSKEFSLKKANIMETSKDPQLVMGNHDLNVPQLFHFIASAMTNITIQQVLLFGDTVSFCVVMNKEWTWGVRWEKPKFPSKT